MKERNKYFGLYINKKIPKIKNKDNNNDINRYYKNIKLEFEGKAFIVDKKGNEKEELKTGEKYKKEGKHTIKLINENEKVYYVDIKIQKLYLILLFFVILFIICSSMYLCFNKKFSTRYSKDETLNFNIDLEGIKYVFDIGYENESFQNIKLTDSVSKKSMIYPGANGYINIIISTKKGNKNMSYKMQVKEEVNKPKNLKFKIYSKTYDSFEELSKNINGQIPKNSIENLKIEWFWDYENYDDITDTKDGINIKNYSVLFKMVGTDVIEVGG